MEVVGGSIPLATTTSPTLRTEVTLRVRGLHPTVVATKNPHSPGITPAESRMLKFLGSTVGIIFLIGLVVVILLLKAIF